MKVISAGDLREEFFRPISDYGYWSICWDCKEREQERRLMELSDGSRVCKDCYYGVEKR